MDRRCFTDVHDFSIRRYNKYETVQSLQEMWAEFFNCELAWIAGHMLGAPGFSETYTINKCWLVLFVEKLLEVMKDY